MESYMNLLRRAGWFVYVDTAGKGTYASIIDTGDYTKHPEFEGQATWKAIPLKEIAERVSGNGYGTHIAGTMGSVTYGIGKVVANMSLGILRLFAQSVNDAAAAAAEARLFMAVAAGNDGPPAILSSPILEPSVCTAGATDSEGNKTSFSN
ncbi:peptidase S8/S53 domain-containing protein [Pseudomassariella vexata]|uniref:Peptidase S8/S53 domain-containing protein n=1 Tax=Pseudomassariella vexata TaxID=1141098 RepID=A0A1Y2DDX2_9PEZI|nr:peptidase S8/S53 domain-containing protein [Pseudomassariella vexata]ORY56875.1 peptidase S8/S53 domain-containing protein [Pseudomassariella vexata]